jgi:hypothetical protein
VGKFSRFLLLQKRGQFIRGLVLKISISKNQNYFSLAFQPLKQKKMKQADAPNILKNQDCKKSVELSLLRIFSLKVEGFSGEEFLLLMRRAWWIPLLALLTLFLMVLVIICLKSGAAVLLTGFLSKTWLKNRSP